MLIGSGFEINKLLSNKFVQLGCFDIYSSFTVVRITWWVC